MKRFYVALLQYHSEKYLLGILFVLSSAWAVAQKPAYLKEFDFKNPKKKSITLDFELINNLMIIPLSINGSDNLRFVLDSGVGHTMITSLGGYTNVTLSNTRKVELLGLGKGESIEAIHSYGNTLKIGESIGINMDILVPLADIFHLSYNLGIEVNGLIGHDVFKSFVVEVDYRRQKLHLHNKDWFKKKLKRYELLPVYIEAKKPYVQVAVRPDSTNKIPVKLLVDSGASHALSLYRQTSEQITLPANAIHSYLGTGLSGDIHGNIGRIHSIELGRFILKKPVATFPEEESVRAVMEISDRHGSIGSDILNRFYTIFDYEKGFLYLKPNTKFKDDFKYNLSGMELGTPLPGLPIYEVAKVRDNSPAGEAGIKKGDQIININGVNVSTLSFSEITEMLQSRPGRKMRVSVIREDSQHIAKFKLKDPI